LKIYLKIGVFWKIYWRDSSISFSILENTGILAFRIPLSLIYWNMLENCIHKNCTYLNILEIRFCHILEFEKYTGKHTGIYWNFIKKIAGHPDRSQGPDLYLGKSCLLKGLQMFKCKNVPSRSQISLIS